jgi:hypothetical protein
MVMTVLKVDSEGRLPVKTWLNPVSAQEGQPCLDKPENQPPELMNARTSSRIYVVASERLRHALEIR